MCHHTTVFRFTQDSIDRLDCMLHVTRFVYVGAPGSARLSSTLYPTQKVKDI